MKTLMINVSINLKCSTGHFCAFVTGSSNSGHRYCSITELQFLCLLRNKAGRSLLNAEYIFML